MKYISLSFLTITLLACSARPAGNSDPDGAHGAVATDGGIHLQPDATTIVDAGRPQLDASSTLIGDDCVIAIRVNTCCPRAEPARRKQLATDNCLLLWRPGGMAVPDGCVPLLWPATCDTIDCAMESRPSSRAVAEVSGRCVFVDECSSNKDCAMAREANTCCPCPAAMPLPYIAEQPCVLIDGEPLPTSCNAQCAEVRCRGCEAVPPPVCRHFDDYSRCVTPDDWA